MGQGRYGVDFGPTAPARTSLGELPSLSLLLDLTPRRQFYHAAHNLFSPGHGPCHSGLSNQLGSGRSPSTASIAGTFDQASPSPLFTFFLFYELNFCGNSGERSPGGCLLLDPFLCLAARGRSLASVPSPAVVALVCEPTLGGEFDIFLQMIICCRFGQAVHAVLHRQPRRPVSAA